MITKLALDKSQELLSQFQGCELGIVFDYPSFRSIKTALALAKVSKKQITIDKRSTPDIAFELIKNPLLLSFMPAIGMELLRGLPATTTKGHEFLLDPKYLDPLLFWEGYARLAHQAEYAKLDGIICLPPLPLDYHEYFDNIVVVDIPDQVAYNNDTDMQTHVEENDVEFDLEVKALRAMRGWISTHVDRNRWINHQVIKYPNAD